MCEIIKCVENVLTTTRIRVTIRVETAKRVKWRVKH